MDDKATRLADATIVQNGCNQLEKDRKYCIRFRSDRHITRKEARGGTMTYRIIRQSFLVNGEIL